MTRRYFVSHDPDGTVSHLVRICETETALWGEYYSAGQWIKDSAVMSYLSDKIGESISEEEAMAIANDADRRTAHVAGASMTRLAAEEVSLLEILRKDRQAREKNPVSDTKPISRPEKHAFSIGLDDAGNPFQFHHGVTWSQGPR